MVVTQHVGYLDKVLPVLSAPEYHQVDKLHFQTVIHEWQGWVIREQQGLVVREWGE
jgi:hypothetical protein